MLGITGRCHCLMLICEVQVKSAQKHCSNFMMRRSDHEKATMVKVAHPEVLQFNYFWST